MKEILKKLGLRRTLSEEEKELEKGFETKLREKLETLRGLARFREANELSEKENRAVDEILQGRNEEGAGRWLIDKAEEARKEGNLAKARDAYEAASALGGQRVATSEGAGAVTRQMARAAKEVAAKSRAILMMGLLTLR